MEIFIKKKKGATLIEVVISMAILIIIIGISINMVLSYNIVLKNRIEVDRLNRELYAITQELKYNHTIEEIIEKSENNKIIIIREDNLLEELLENNLFEMEQGEGITVYINIINEDMINIGVKIETEIDKKNYKVEGNFNKLRWMDEI